jgi:hypothetical protein
MKFPAVVVVHTPTGPINACREHANMAANLYAAMCAHTNETPLEEPAECTNCINSSKQP